MGNKYFFIVLYIFFGTLLSDYRDIPDIATKVGTYSPFFIESYPLNQLSAFGMTRSVNGSTGDFSIGNPALLNLHRKPLIEFSSYNDSRENNLINQNPIANPFLALNIILPLRYKNKTTNIGISFNNIYSMNSSIENSINMSSIDIEQKLNKYSIAVASELKLFNYTIYYGAQLNQYSYKESIYEIIDIEGQGRSITYGLFIPLSNIKIGLNLETETIITINMDNHGLTVGPDDPGGNLQQVTTYNSYQPKNIGLGFTSLLTRELELYFEYNRYFYTSMESHSYNSDIKNSTMGFRYMINEQFLATIGYYKVNEHIYDNISNNFFDNEFWNRSCINLGLAYNTKLFIYDIGWTIKGIQEDNYFLKLSISLLLDSYISPFH